MQNKKNHDITAREAALKSLVKAEGSDSYINLVLPGYLSKVPAGERAFAVNICYGTVQHLNTLDWALELFLNRSLKSLTPLIRNLLRIAAYQILYMDNVSPPAAVDISVKLAYRYGHRGVARLVNAVLRRVAENCDTLPFPGLKENPSLHISLVYSFPPWMVNRWIKRMGIESTQELCKAYNTVPPVIIRTNTLKASRDQLAETLSGEGLQTEEVPFLPEALRVFPKSEISLSRLESFRSGLFSIQGEPSIFAGRMLNPAPGKTLVDLCSAPGGKTTHMGELMKNEGMILAGDIHESRIGLVDKMAGRLGIKIIQTRLWDGREVDNIVSPVDYVLCDAPCSGLGVINRKPDLKWHKNEEGISVLGKIQKQLLSASASIVKPGGKLLYSVCSNEPEETGEVTDYFLRNHPSFKPADLPEITFEPGVYKNYNHCIAEFLPHVHKKEGFFMALFTRS